MSVSSFLFPILDGKVLNVNMPPGGTTSVDHLDSGLVIFADWGGSSLRKLKFRKDRTKKFCNFVTALTAARNSASVPELAVMV